MSKWYLQDGNITFRWSGKEFYWSMPAGFKMPSQEVLSLVEYILLKPFGVKVEVLSKEKPDKHRTALAFSGGVDSAAAYELLDSPLPIYTQVANPSKLHKQENALLALQEVNGISVITNQDELACLYGKNKGFYGAAGWTIPSVLLSEHYGLDTFADGNILEFVYLRSKNGHGTQYVKPSYQDVFSAFSKLGYHYCMPCAGLTEVSTTQIAKNYKYVMGCMRGQGGKPCLNCMKCYRKMAIQGRCIPSNGEVEKVLSREWIPVLATLLWARDINGLSHPSLANIDLDYSWVDKWFGVAIEFIPSHLRSFFLTKLAEFGIDTLEDNDKVYKWSSKQ